MSVEAWVNYAVEANTCPGCGMHLGLTGIYHPKFIKNIWRHHIATLHKDEVT